MYSYNKEDSLPQIQYSNIQNTERDFRVKSGEEMSTNKEKKQYAKRHQEPNKKIEKYIFCQKKLCIIILIVALICGIVGGVVTFLVVKPKCQSNTTPTTPTTPTLPATSTTGFTVAIMGTNDLDGKVYPTKLVRSDTNQPYNYGGLSTLLTLRNIVSKQYNGNFLYLDAGDQLLGGIQSSELVSSGQIMNDFFKSANLTASAVGDHWLDLGPEFQLSYLKGRETSILAANIIRIAGQPQWIPNLQKSKIINLPNGIKIGLIGYTTTFFGGIYIPGLRWKKPEIKYLYSVETELDSIKNQSQKLRNQGVNAIVLIAHAGNDFENNFASGIWMNKNSQISKNKNPLNEISKLIDSLPEGTIDAVVQGHRYTFAHNYYKGIPFMGTINGGYYTNFMYLNFDKDKKLINSSIEGPVPICEKIFQNTGRCDYVQAADISKAGKLIPWKFHGVDVTPNEQFNQIIKSKWDQKMGAYRDQIIVNTEIKLTPKMDQQSELGNLFTNLLQQIVPTVDFVILDPKIFRSQWFPGPINYEQFFRMFPFTNQIKTFTITGNNLIQSLKQSSNSFLAVWNLQPIFQSQRGNYIKPTVNPALGNGTLIFPQKIYKGVTVSFCYEHRDIFFKINQLRMSDIQFIGQFRQLVKPYLKKIGTIKKGILMNLLKPRAIVSYIEYIY